ncbi:hypothetical protein ACLB2K_012952 [Fragaria x ananassa]
MDKSWMHADRRSKEFELGFEEFLKFAESNAVNIDKISCPCKKCCNVDGFSVEVVRDHVFYYGILESYKVWRWHGESMYDNGVESESESESESVNGDPGMGENDVEVGESEDEEMSEDSNEFLKFVEDGDQPLYNGCDHTTKMNFLVESFSWKAKHVVTDSCFGDFLELVKGLLPAENLVPLTTNDAKKTLSVLGMDYEKIHACPNDCILYRGDAVLVDAEECPSCGVSRWKLGRDNIPKKNVPAKVLWYFPPIPRFKRFYQSPKTAKNLTWHDWGRKKDKMMRHPADSPTWKLLDSKYPELGNDHRNLRLALSSDGFNPHSMQNSLYSCWPVILVTYNLPPWLCMKRKFMMLTLLISGPKQPGNDIDVYLQPLIDDLKLLWNGVEEVYDAFRGEYFKLKAVRLDMVAMGIRTELKPDVSGKRTKLPLASWNCKLDEKKIVCGSFFGMKVPTGFSSNIRNLVSMEDLKLSKLKSHDCHVVMQVLLPVALRSVLEKPVRYAIIRFCLFFKAICAKEIDVSKLEQMQADLVVTVCQLEKYFPPSFFDVMIHLTVHLVREVTLCGPVFFRWMYPFERYMKVFKGWVRSRRHPEGCIAESYVVEEAVEFCAEGLLNDDASTAGMPENSKPEVMAGSSTSSLNARALALRTKTKEFLRKRGRSEVANEEASVGKAATPRRSPRSTKVVVVDQTSKDAPTKADVVLPRRSPRSTARTSKDALNNARVGPAKATQSKKSVASKKLSFGSMSNSGSGKRKAGKSKAGKSKAGTMEVVESDDEDEEFEADEDEEESNENVTGGMRLLRRGMVTMSRVNRRLVRGRKLKVKYNDDGEPVGRAAKEMQSYIGVFARTKVPINVKDWRLVPLSVKDNIWGSIEEAYVVPKQWKKMVFASAGQKWRDFKSKLTTWYIIPFMDSPELFEFPPDDYRSIHADQWQEFVKDRISPQFQEFRQKQMARRKENKYPHRLGRKPYAQLQEELAATVPVGRKLVRTTMWKAARQDKDGNYLAPQVQEKVDEIDKLEKEEQEGKRKFEGPVDVLTTALGTPEYSGRVRGVGGFVKPEAYFHLPKRARLNLDARQRIKNGEEDDGALLL